jgi:uncharacterized membrane protein YeiB
MLHQAVIDELSQLVMTWQGFRVCMTMPLTYFLAHSVTTCSPYIFPSAILEVACSMAFIQYFTRSIYKLRCMLLCAKSGKVSVSCYVHDGEAFHLLGLLHDGNLSATRVAK